MLAGKTIQKIKKTGQNKLINYNIIASLKESILVE